MIDHRINAISLKPIRRGTRVSMVDKKRHIMVVERDPKGDFKVITSKLKISEIHIQIRNVE